MPYPFTNYNWRLIILGNEVRYSINTFLVACATFRSYVLMKLIKHINLYSTDQARRIATFFNIQRFHIFLYRSNMTYRGFLTMLFLFTFIVYLTTVVFKLLENFEANTSFSFTENNLWFLITTMTTGKV
jgi:hypothetical protein